MTSELLATKSHLSALENRIETRLASAVALLLSLAASSASALAGLMTDGRSWLMLATVGRAAWVDAVCEPAPASPAALDVAHEAVDVVAGALMMSCVCEGIQTLLVVDDEGEGAAAEDE